jgi:transposase
MQAGAEFPPVTLAHIDGSLYLVDGWHRVAAALANNQYLILANVSEMTFDEARWYAAKANTEHGLPLKAKELREVFRAFIETRQHEQERGQRLMPYREIAKRIGKGFSTIRNWMKADYPRLFEKYQQMANGAPDDTDFDREAKMMERRLTKAEADIRNVRNTGRALDPENLGKLIHAVRETLSDLETKPYEPVEFNVDF